MFVLEKINRITDKTLQQKTGKTWQQWFAILHSVNAEGLHHKEIAQFLSTQPQVNDWWAQMITVGYEQYYGRRERHQKPDGYEISVSKTYPLPLSSLFNAWTNETVRKKWLTEDIHIRKKTANKSLRITWVDNVTSVTVNFYEKGIDKSQVVVQHAKLTDKDTAENQKLFWKSKLSKLEEILQH